MKAAGALPGVALVMALVMALAGCSQPTDVTGSAGQPTQTGAAPAAPGTGVDPSLQASLPACPAVGAQPAVADGLPDLSLACLGPGGPVDLAGLRGKPLIINTWASWCQPCRSELPALASFWQRWQEEVDVIGLNVSDDPGAAAALWRELRIGFPSVTDPEGSTRGPLTWVGLPVTYFVDADGVVVGRHAGAVADEAEWESLVGEKLGVS